MVGRPKFNYKTAGSDAGLIKLKFEKLPPKILQLYLVRFVFHGMPQSKERGRIHHQGYSEWFVVSANVNDWREQISPNTTPDPSWQENLQQKCIHTVSGFVADSKLALSAIRFIQILASFHWSWNYQALTIGLYLILSMTTQRMLTKRRLNLMN